MTREKTGSLELAAKIKELRHKQNLTQEALAETAGVSLALIQKLENGGRYGRKETHERIAKALGVSVAYLISDPKQVDPASNPKINEYTIWLLGQDPSEDDLEELKSIAEIVFAKNRRNKPK